MRYILYIPNSTPILYDCGKSNGGITSDLDEILRLFNHTEQNFIDWIIVTKFSPFVERNNLPNTRHRTDFEIVEL